MFPQFCSVPTISPVGQLDTGDHEVEEEEEEDENEFAFDDLLNFWTQT